LHLRNPHFSPLRAGFFVADKFPVVFGKFAGHYGFFGLSFYLSKDRGPAKAPFVCLVPRSGQPPLRFSNTL
jgi:hypothetical protein